MIEKDEIEFERISLDDPEDQKIFAGVVAAAASFLDANMRKLSKKSQARLEAAFRAGSPVVTVVEHDGRGQAKVVQQIRIETSAGFQLVPIAIFGTESDDDEQPPPRLN